ncbi:MAG: hypothetical protein SF066_02325 [Thermoanaerobaculia bacterium]|nr:hypothetical protein [Thermoanaerobaculia bacterium]
MRHLTTESLRALLADDPAAWAEYRKAAEDSAGRPCPECESLLSDLVSRRDETLAADHWFERATRHALEVTHLEPSAAGQVRELLAVPGHAERLALVRRHPGRFGNPFLVTRLITTAQSALRTDPRQTARLAELAVAAARELPRSLGEVLPLELELEARAVEANALRAAGDLVAADRRLCQVLGQLPEIADPLLELDVLSYAVSLRKDQRRFVEAEVFVDQALDLAEELEDSEQQARLFIMKADLQYYSYRLHLAVTSVQTALQLRADSNNSWLLQCAHHNLASYLVEGGLYREAQSHLQAHRACLRGGQDPYSQLRLRWLEGLIAEGLGDALAAEGGFRLVQQAFLSKGMTYDAAIVTLDLAALLLESGRTGEVVELASAALAAFQAVEVERESLGALSLLRSAAQAGQASASLARLWARQLRRGDPSGLQAPLG